MAANDDRSAYSRALLANDLSTLCAIEKRNGLYGYPPDVVSVGLAAAAQGKDAAQAAEDYIEGRT